MLRLARHILCLGGVGDMSAVIGFSPPFAAGFSRTILCRIGFVTTRILAAASGAAGFRAPAAASYRETPLAGSWGGESRGRLHPEAALMPVS